MSPKLSLKSSGPTFWTDSARGERDKKFYIYAHEFHRAALKTGSPLVKAYLLGHALELFLKTYLLTHGIEERDLKNKEFGHRLAKLLGESRRLGLDRVLRVSPELVADITAFGRVYGAKDLEYFSILHLLVPPRLPNLRRLVRFAQSFDKKLGDHFVAATQRPRS